MAEIYRDNEGIVLKKLGKPVRRTIVDKNTRVSDDMDIEIPDEPTARPSARKTLIANAGPSEDGKIDFSVNPDCVDYLLQYHESYGHANDAEGVKATSEKICSNFNKTFKSKMTPSELALGLESRLITTETIKNRQAGQRLRPKPLEDNETGSEKAPEAKQEEVNFAPLRLTSLDTVTGGKVLLSGEKYEICKILNCKSVCVVSRNRGKIEQNGLFHAACSNSDRGEINKKLCPQEAPLNDKEEIAYQLFLQQFADETKAKKMLFISKEVFSSK